MLYKVLEKARKEEQNRTQHYIEQTLLNQTFKTNASKRVATNCLIFFLNFISIICFGIIQIIEMKPINTIELLTG